MVPLYHRTATDIISEAPKGGHGHRISLGSDGRPGVGYGMQAVDRNLSTNQNDNCIDVYRRSLTSDISQLSAGLYNPSP